MIAALNQYHLSIMGTVQQGDETIVLLGPASGAGYWDAITNSPEWKDGAPDPVDRWSRRVITALARDLSGHAYFPFGDDPAPFLTWAVDSGQNWASPLGMLVNHRTGLLVSFRGAIGFDALLPVDPATNPCPKNPCPTCAAPCQTACPVDAFQNGYDVPKCIAHLETPQGQKCLNNGCLARRACPISATWETGEGQLGYHMRMFYNARKETT